MAVSVSDMCGVFVQGRHIYFVWAESIEGLKVSPSLLLAHMLLSSRREAAMFLRMATGFGFGQIGDYTASLFYLFRCAMSCYSSQCHNFNLIRSSRLKPICMCSCPKQATVALDYVTVLHNICCKYCCP